MTAPFTLPPPKSFRGLSSRELLSAEVGDGSTPPLGVGLTPDVDLTIAEGDPTVMTAQPSGETEYFAEEVWFDTRAFNQMRVVVAKVETAGHTTARVLAKYKSSTGGTYATPGAASAEVSAPIATTGPQKSSAWVALDPNAIGDRLWHAVGVGGNATLSPVTQGVHFQFRQATAPPPNVLVPLTGYDFLFMSHLGTFDDEARTTPVSANLAPIGGLENQIVGATLHGRQTTSGQRPIVSTVETINGFRTIRLDRTVPYWFQFVTLVAGWTEGTVFYVVKSDFNSGAANGLSQMGANAQDTWYPETDGHIRISDGSTVRKDVGDPTEDLTQWQVIAVRSMANEWAFYIDTVQKFQTSTNTVQWGGTGGTCTLGINSGLGGFSGYIAAFAGKQQWMDDTSIVAQIQLLKDFYGL